MQQRFIQLESDIEGALMRYIVDIRGASSHIVRNIRSSKIFEGDGSSIFREDSTRDETEIRKFSSEVSVDKEKILYGDWSEIIECFHAIGLEMASEQERMLFKVVEDATTRTGNVVSAEGKPISLDLILKMLEKVWIDFDRSGQPKLPTIVVGDEVGEQIRKLMNSPDVGNEQKKFDDLMRRKKEEWLAREADRTLVG
ncbi:hypothetical protein [Neorhizobium alkalisoli]|uniref:Uncharacterized protein n=1 Tax=Neorhizobium alkalisoli TaxID=528178 RepID=A0A561QHI0_9HYPH|nr:hypothetical protein [Neorhizobium alkalisoli]TWF49792.1 hypothetical protein FHW37_107159 [Neorhizobium alkalisoli]